jgi:hypothetical protein
MAVYSTALIDGAEVIVKIDGVGQMDPNLISSFVSQILAGEADYTKGNRFYDLEKINLMPKTRLIGNAALIRERPHEGQLYYEFRGFSTWDTLSGKLLHWIESNHYN